MDIKDLNERVLRLAMVDTARNSLIALPLVMLLEVYMIISWILNVDDKTATSSLCYMIGYVCMLVFSGMIVLFILHVRKNIDRRYHQVNVMQHGLSIVFVLWCLSFTYVGSEMRGHFDYLIFITFVTSLPLFCYLRPAFWIVVQLAATMFMFYLASHHDRFFPFLINFSVFTLISITCGLTLHLIRRLSYERQIELEEERNLASRLAHKDALTDLPNRHSFSEDFEKLRTDIHSDNLIILACDVNGLKPVNDNLGHEAGDELIKGAAFCLQEAFHELGCIYRVGGDEFTGILHGTEEQLQEAIRQFEWVTSNWKGQIVKQLSISIGYASVRSNPSETINSLLTLADNNMYEAKRRYYLTHQR